MPLIHLLTPCPGRSITRWLACLLLVLAFTPAVAAAQVQVHFQSFNGSLFVGRYPHTFVMFEGRLDTGEAIDENFGFTAKSSSPAALLGPVAHMIYVERPAWIAKTNRHFSVTVDDATYRRMRAEVEAWRNAPGNYYDLDRRNCIHFVGRMAEMAGLKVDFPKAMLRKPRAWLNHIGQLNPALAAKLFT